MDLKPTMLVVIFWPKLTLALSQTKATPALQLRNQTFIDPRDDFYLVFYDWLRNDTKQVVGVRFGLYEVPYLAEELNRFPYVRVNEPWDIEVFFTSQQSYVDAYSRLQDFSEFRVLKSAQGDYAIAISTHFLEDADLKKLKTYDVDWETLRWDAE